MSLSLMAIVLIMWKVGSCCWARVLPCCLPPADTCMAAPDCCCTAAWGSSARGGLPGGRRKGLLPGGAHQWWAALQHYFTHPRGLPASWHLPDCLHLPSYLPAGMWVLASAAAAMPLEQCMPSLQPSSLCVASASPRATDCKPSKCVPLPVGAGCPHWQQCHRGQFPAGQVLPPLAAHLLLAHHGHLHAAEGEAARLGGRLAGNALFMAGGPPGADTPCGGWLHGRQAGCLPACPHVVDTALCLGPRAQI